MFQQRERNWSCLRNPSITERSNRDSDRNENFDDLREEDKAQIFERKKQLEAETKMLKDVRARLEVHRVALRLVVAESLKDYHEQFKMILSQPALPVQRIGPELLELNRENLKLQLDMSKIKPPTQEEQKIIDNKISERFAARLSNLSSPERRSDPQPPKTANTRNLSQDKRLEQSEDGGRSTAMSTQRPPDRLRSNAGLSPQAAPPATYSGPASGGQRGSRNMSAQSSGEQLKAATATQSEPASAKGKILTHAKKNATITEEDDETESNPEQK